MENQLCRKCTFLRIPPYYGTLLSHPQEPQLPLAIATSAACLKDAGYEVEILDLWIQKTSRPRLFEILARIRTDLVIMHIDSMNRKVVLDIADRLRSDRGHDIPLAAMGQYAEAFPSELLIPNGYFDACIFGEPEHTLVELADCISNGRSLDGVAGLAYSDEVSGAMIRNRERKLIEDLDSLPFPAYEIFDLDAYNKQSSFVPIKGPVRWGWLLSSRGCPFNCIFCSPTLRKSCGQTFRGHSAKYVADVVEKLKYEFGCNAVAFEDDVFSLSKKRTMEICDEFLLRGIDIDWTAQTHLATLDEELIRRMHEAGCRGLCMGIESGSDEVRARIKGQSLKREVLLRNVELLHEVGIAPTLYFMIGNPGETLEQMEQTLKLALELKPMMIQLAFFTPYPGSKAWETYLDKSVKDPELSHYNRFTINLSAEPDEKVLRFYRRFYRKFYLNPSFIYRFLRYRLPYTMRQSNGKEWKLLLRSLLFLALPIHNVRIPQIKWNRRD